jgi:hypothetical protein
VHIDEEWAREHHAFGGRVAQGMLVASVTYALRAPAIDNIDLVGWMEELRRFRAPCVPTIRFAPSGPWKKSGRARRGRVPALCD